MLGAKIPQILKVLALETAGVLPGQNRTFGDRRTMGQAPRAGQAAPDFMLGQTCIPPFLAYWFTVFTYFHSFMRVKK